MLERIHQQAITDPLTRLGNRRSLVTDLDRALEAANEGSERILIIFDLNGFKRYNDTFGHPSGDQLLRRLSDQLARPPSRTAPRTGSAATSSACSPSCPTAGPGRSSTRRRRR